MSKPYDRPAANPGGMDCQECGVIFVGEEWHQLCAVCEAHRVPAMTDTNSKAQVTDELVIKAICEAVILGTDGDYKPVHLEPREARQAIAAYHAALAAQEKPEPGVDLSEVVNFVANWWATEDGHIAMSPIAAAEYIEKHFANDAKCRHCKGKGYQAGDPEANPIEACDYCGGSGESIKKGEMKLFGHWSKHRLADGVFLPLVCYVPTGPDYTTVPLYATAVAPSPDLPEGEVESATSNNTDELRSALEWYGEQARLARLIHSEGDKGRWALAEDGGKRAREILAPLHSEAQP